MRLSRPTLAPRIAPPTRPRSHAPAPPAARAAAPPVERVPYLFVPDISQLDPAGAAAAVAMVNEMSLAELVLRGAAEIALCFGVAVAAVTVLRKWTEAADKVSREGVGWRECGL